MADRVVSVSLIAKINSYMSDMDRVSKKNREVGESADDAASRFEAQNAAMREAGAAALTVGSIATAATALAVKAAIDWESAWAGVTKTVDGTPAQLAEVEAGLRGLAKELPATHQELAAVAEAAGQLGVARDDIVDFTRTMVMLGETTNLTADEAATSIAQLMNVMQTAPDDVDNLGASLVALGNDGASTERDIIQMAQRIAGAGRTIGLSEAEVMGFANALASVGIEAEAGGSAISRIMTDIAMSVSSGGADLEKFAQVAGMSASQFSEAFKNDPADAIATFIEGLGRVNAAGGDVFGTLESLGQSDIRVSQALLGMANSGDLLRKSLELGAKAWEENTALQSEAEKRFATTEAQLQILGNTINDAAINFGSAFLPAVNGAAKALGEFANFMGGLPPEIQSLIAAGTGLVGVIALVGGAALIALPKIAAFKLALVELGVTGATTKGVLGSLAAFMKGPWGIALVAAAAGMMVLQDAVDSAKASAAEWQNVIKNTDSADRLFQTAAKGVPLISQTLREATTDADTFKQKLDLIANNDFARGFDLGASQLKEQLKEIGDQLSTTATSDLPAAQNAFRTLADDMKLTEQQQMDLLDAMPGYRDALYEQAAALDINVTSADEAANKQKLLELATGNAAAGSQTAADAYLEAASGAQELTTQLGDLIDVINEANGVGQDAISANIAYQDALAKVDEQIQNAKDGVEGYALGLDLNTEAGRTNMGMLNDLAARSQAAADAQFALDGNTSNYKATLEAGRQALITRAQQMGLNADQARKLADQIYRIPDSTEWDAIVQTAAAQAAIDRFVFSNNGRTITLRTQVEGVRSSVGNGTPGGFGFSAGGSRVYANSTGNMYEGIHKGGRPIYKFAEYETGWETFVSGRRGYERDNLRYAFESIRRLGHQNPQALRDVAGPQPAGKQEYHFHQQPIRDNDPHTTATILGREFGRQVAGR